MDRTILPERVRRRARLHGERTVFTFLADGETEAVRLSWAELADAVRAVAAAVAERARPGERALLVYPPGLDFAVAFLACLEAGVVAVPAHPPARRGGLDALLRLAADAEPRMVLSAGPLGERLRAEVAGAGAAAGSLARAAWLATDEVDPAAGGAPLPARPRPDDLAFLQYTSGSTGDPKGVAVTHAQLAANERAIELAFRQSEASVVVSWLPPYHDMGLIGTVLQPVWSGGRAVLMAPAAFLQRPRRWLAAVTRYRATTTGGPDFAWALAAARIPPAEREGLDLSSLEVAFTGAEPVRPATLDAFAGAFAGYGFRRRAFYPCYGLAEATLFVTGGAVDEPPVVRSVPAAAGGGAPRRLVGCGRTAAGTTVLAVDPDRLVPLPAGAEGEIWVAGPAVASGYHGRRQESGRTFGARLAGGAGPDLRGPFLRTGDLGVVGEDGELFVTGRTKDLIVVRGRNLYPQDVESAAESAHPALRSAAAAAFALEAEGAERLAVVFEIERRREAEADAAAAAVHRAVRGSQGVAPWAVVAIRAGTLPRTTSGKVRRSATRDAFLAGGLVRLAGRGEGVPDLADPTPDGSTLSRGAVRPVGGEPAGDAARVRAIAAALLAVPAADLDPDRPLELDSLQAVELRNRLETELGAAPPLSALLTLGPRAIAEALRPLGSMDADPDGEDGAFPLSAGQRALWLLERLRPGAAGLHLAFAARVTTADGAPPPRAAVERAVAGWLDRHPALRTAIGGDAAEPVQRPSPAAGAPGLVSMELVSTEAAGCGLAELLAAETARPFDLARGPLLRARWIEIGDGGAPVLLVVVHHLAADFWSLELLLEDLARVVPEDGTIGSRAVAPAAASYSAFVRRQEALLAGEEGRRLAAWWRRELDGAPSVLELPADRPRPPVASHLGAAHTFRLPERLAERVRAEAAARGTTPFVVLLGAFQALLARLAGRRDVLVGSPAAGRLEARFEEVVGYFANLLPLRADLAGDPSFGEIVERAGRRVRDALDHQELPFPLLVERLAPERDAARHPLVQTGFVLEAPRRGAPEGVAPFVLGEAGARVAVGGWRLESVALPRRTVQLDLLLTVAPEGAGYAASLEYATDLFDPSTAERLAERYRRVLAAGLADPGLALSRLPLLSDEERLQALGLAGPTVAFAAEERVPPPVHRAFAEWARRTPEAPAVVWRRPGGPLAGLTYRELAARAAALSAELARHGVGAESVVGVLVGRVAARPAALVAVLAAGGSFVAIEPDEPPGRVRALLAGCGARVVIVGAGAPPPPGEWSVVEVDDEGRPARGPGDGASGPFGLVAPPSAGEVHPEAAAYRVHTSGSTGAPKAVIVPHRAIGRLAASARQDLAIGPGSRMLHLASLAFDISHAELLVPLASGAAVCLAGADARRSGRALAAEIAALDATAVITTPTVLGMIPESEDLWSLVTLCIGGEPSPPRLAERWAPGRRLVNAYGPAEATVYATLSRCPAGEPERMGVLGRPIAGGRLVVCGPWGELTPPGALGEIRLGGEGLARGYHGRPRDTAERFVPDPWAETPGARLYRTGDLGRRRADGEVEFAGRVDDQVKVRGHRVEPGEVEAALVAHPAIAEAAVVVVADRLVAWTVAAPGESLPEVAELRSFLGRVLPGHMIPSVFAPLDSLPLGPTGKLDRRALAARAAAVAGAAAAGAGAAPRSELERLLARLWAEVLGVDRVRVDASFFDLGGHSLELARVHERLCAALGRDVSIGDLFRHPTIASLAAHLSGADDAAEDATGPDARGDGERAESRGAARRAALRRRRAVRAGSGAVNEAVDEAAEEMADDEADTERPVHVTRGDDA